MIFLWIFNTSIWHHITVKYKFTNLPHHQSQIHFSGHHLAGFHYSTPRNQNHFQFSRHIHICLHILRLMKSHVHLWSVYRNHFSPSDRCRWTGQGIVTLTDLGQLLPWFLTPLILFSTPRPMSSHCTFQSDILRAAALCWIALVGPLWFSAPCPLPWLGWSSLHTNQ